MDNATNQREGVVPRPSELTLDHIARFMCESVERLRTLAEDMESHYFPPRVELVDGKERVLDVPVDWMMRRLGLLHGRLQRVFRSHPAAHGGIRGCSCFTSARKHLGRQFVVQRDIQDCFPSISRAMIEASLRFWMVAPEVRHVLACLLTVRDRIPQGSPISGAALNIFFGEFDQRMASYCGSVGASFTRTYDDIVISFDSVSLRTRLQTRVDHEIAGLGLRINERKRKRRGLQHHNQLQIVHNLIVNSSRGIRVSPEVSRRLMRWGEEYVQGGRSATQDSLSALASKRQRLMGYVSHYSQADVGPGPALRRLIKQGDRHIEARLRAAGLIWRGQRWRRAAMRPGSIRRAENPHASTAVPVQVGPADTVCPFEV